MELNADIFVNLNIAGVNKFGIGGSENISYQTLRVPDGSAGAPGLRGSDTDSGIFFSGNNTRFTSDGANRFSLDALCNINLSSITAIRWTNSGTDPNAGHDLILVREAAGVLGQRNGVNPQSQLIYNTFTDAANLERGFMRWNSGRFEIGVEALGTGTDRVTTLMNRSKTGAYGPRVDIRLEPDGGSFFQSLSFIYSGGVPIQWGINGTMVGHFAAGGFSAGAGVLGFSSGPATGIDAGFKRVAANVVGVISAPSGSDVAGALEFMEMASPPGTPGTDRSRIYFEDNGAGKTRCVIKWQDGTTLVLGQQA